MADQGANARRVALIADCDRICGLNSKGHKDRCPLYKANCEALAASRRLGNR